MAYAHQTPEENAAIESWLDRNKSKTPLFSRSDIESFLGESISDDDWRHTSVSLAVCFECESPLLSIELAIVEYGHLANIICGNCGHQYSLLMKTDMLI